MAGVSGLDKLQRAELARHVYSTFHDDPSYDLALDFLGTDLCYLMGAILKDTHVEWTHKGPGHCKAGGRTVWLYNILLTEMDLSHHVWKFIHLTKD